MVHALKHVHRILQPEGLLINVLDTPTPHIIEVHSAGNIIMAGWVMDSMDFENTRFALNALAQVASEGDFLLEDERDFSYNIHADDMQELQEWLSDWWETAVLPENTFQRVDDILQQVGQVASVVLRVPARMTKLRAA